MTAAERWRCVSERLGSALPVGCLHPRAWAAVVTAGQTGPVVAAVSGGVDSTVLAVLLHRYLPGAGEGRLVLAHFNHGWRGRASGQDARAVRALGRALGLPVVVGRGRSATRTEAAARSERTAWLESVAAERRAAAIVTGHQADDAAETVLMRLARGASAAGLAAPRPVQSRHQGLPRLRPLLTLTRAELIAAARASGLRWRDDASNRSRTHERNRIRHDVLPAFQRACGRDVVRALARSRSLLEAEDEALAAWVAEAGPSLAQADRLSLGRLRGRPSAFIARAVESWLDRHGRRAALAPSTVDALVEALRQGREGVWNAVGGARLSARGRTLRWSGGTEAGSGGPPSG